MKNFTSTITESETHTSIQPTFNIQPRYEPEVYNATDALSERNVVITATEYGVGKAVALAFAKEGANIIMVYQHDKHEKELGQFAAKIKSLGRKVWLFRSFIFEEFKCRKLLESIIKKVQRIDIVVNIFPILNKAQEEMHYLLKKSDTLKIQGLFTMGRLAPEYLDTNGVIINSTYICSYAQPDQLAFFSAMKAAIKNYTMEMHRMLPLYQKNLRSNAVTAGFIWTESVPDSLPDYNAAPQEMSAVAPMHPYEIAPLFVFLARKEAAMISGETLDARGKIIKF